MRTRVLACDAYNMHSPCDTGVFVFPATMILPSRKETYDPYTPSVSSSPSINGVLHHRSSKETIQSQEGSISHFSFHSATAAIDKDLFDLSRQEHLLNHSSITSNGRDPSTISDYKSFHSLKKPTFRFRNQSLSTVCTISEPESDRSSTATSTPRHRFHSLSVSSLEDDAESSPPSTPRSSRAITPILITYPSPFLSPVNAVPPCSLDDGDSQPLTLIETSTAVTPSIQEYKELLSNVNHHAAVDHTDTVILPRKSLHPTNSHNDSKPSRSQDYKSDFSSPPAPSSRRASKVTVEYHKPSRQSIQEYQELLNLHAAPATNYKDPPPVSSHSASKTSRSQDHKSDFPLYRPHRVVKLQK